MRYLTFSEIVELHRMVIEQSGGSHGVRDAGAVESAVSQPLQTFDGRDLYTSVVEKASALGFFLIANHPFIDGNKRIGHAAMEVTLILNGFELHAEIDNQEEVILGVARGDLSREQFFQWVLQHSRRVG